MQGLTFIVGDTHDDAVEKDRRAQEYLNREGIAMHLLGDAGIDAGGLPLDTPLSTLGEFRGVHSVKRWTAEYAGDREPTIADVAAVSWERRLVGTPDEIADALEEWRDAGIRAVNVKHLVRPGTFRDVGEKLLPTLRRRGLARSVEDSGPQSNPTLRRVVSGRDRLPPTHPAAGYRGVFTDASLRDPGASPGLRPATTAPLRERS